MINDNRKNSRLGGVKVIFGVCQILFLQNFSFKNEKVNLISPGAALALFFLNNSIQFNKKNSVKIMREKPFLFIDLMNEK